MYHESVIEHKRIQSVEADQAVGRHVRAVVGGQPLFRAEDRVEEPAMRSWLGSCSQSLEDRVRQFVAQWSPLRSACRWIPVELKTEVAEKPIDIAPAVGPARNERATEQGAPARRRLGVPGNWPVATMSSSPSRIQRRRRLDGRGPWPVRCRLRRTRRRLGRIRYGRGSESNSTPSRRTPQGPPER